MEAEHDPADGRVTLSTTSGAPSAFTVHIAVPAMEGASRRFAVTGTDPATGAEITGEYRLPDAGQNAYLDLFAGLARRFGTRLPRNRRPRETPAFEAPYQALLTENLSPDILYGYGDPAVLRVEAGRSGRGEACYYLLATSNDAPDAFPILRSRDLREWRPAGFVFPRGRKPAWAADGPGASDYWAPEMHRLAGGFLVCFAARGKDGELAIGTARSDRPEGPFAAADEPLLRGGVIDPHVLIAEGGDAYLFWKEDANDLWPGLLCRLLREHDGLIAGLFPHAEDRRTASLAQALWPWAEGLGPMERFFVLQPLVEAVTADYPVFRARLAAVAERTDPAARGAIGAVLRAMRTPIYAQRLAPDGVGLLGERAVVLENDRAWEAHLVEGVWVVGHRGKYYMLYSGNDFSTDEYGIGAAVADAPLGPYRKMEGHLLRSTARWSGPGHPSVAPGPDGRPWMFLHAFFPGRAGYKEFRALLAAPIAFREGRVALRPGASLLGHAR